MVCLHVLMQITRYILGLRVRTTWSSLSTKKKSCTWSFVSSTTRLQSRGLESDQIAVKRFITSWYYVYRSHTSLPWCWIIDPLASFEVRSYQGYMHMPTYIWYWKGDEILLVSKFYKCLSRMCRILTLSKGHCFLSKLVNLCTYQRLASSYTFKWQETHLICIKFHTGCLSRELLEMVLFCD